MKKGNIYYLRPRFRKLYPENYFRHMFVFWKSENSDIRGIMLTTENKPEYKNILMLKEHFQPDFKYGYPASFIAPLYLLKKVKFKHLKKISGLSKSGTKFIASIIPDLEYTDWGKIKSN